MAAVTIRRMQEIENQVLFAREATEEDLLRMAGEALGHALGQHVKQPGLAVGFLGKGHNAGDAIVALRVLREVYGWQVCGRLAFRLEDCSPLTRQVWKELAADEISAQELQSKHRANTGTMLLLDGLLGTGAQGEPRGPLGEIAYEINQLRQQIGALVVAVDVPTGVDADLGTIHPGAVHADLTLMIANAKCGLLTATAASATGALGIVPVPILRESRAPSAMEFICPEMMSFAKAPRDFDTHKGHYGRVWLWVGSRAYAGAAALSAKGALHGGAGLVTVFTPADAHAGVRALCPPEVMVRELDWNQLPDIHGCDVLVLGCGLGEISSAPTRACLGWLKTFPGAVVLDADALNAVARHGGLEQLTPRHIVTPHPGEFARLFPEGIDLPREQAALQFCRKFASVLVLKGARTIVTAKDMPLWINGTGGPSMACGGQGDLLAGVIGAQLAKGLAPAEAAALAVWVCGRAAERALRDGEHSEESLTPSHCASNLGSAFLDWRKSRR